MSSTAFHQKFALRENVRRSPFTLIEWFIAMTLTIFLLSTVGFFYRYFVTLERKATKIQEEQFTLRFLEGRLSDIFERITKADQKEEKFLFYTPDTPSHLFKSGEPRLLFLFDNCVKSRKSFAGFVIGELFVDPDDRLTLAVWPEKMRWGDFDPLPLHKEILLEDVTNLHLLFLGDEESSYWERDQEKLPKLIRLSFNWKGETMSYTFPLLNQTTPIRYTQ